MSQNNSKKPILFFDGVCGLCNRSVNFLLSIDKKEKILFSPLQGNTAEKLLPKNISSDLNSLIFLNQEAYTQKSTAILKILKEIGGLWSLFYFLIIIPTFMRDFLYNWVAKSRYKWFGKSDTCRLPTPEEKKRFLP